MTTASSSTYKNGNSRFYTATVTTTLAEANNAYDVLHWESNINFGEWYQWGARLETYVNGQRVGNVSGACTYRGQTICASSGNITIYKTHSWQDVSIGVKVVSERVNGYGGVDKTTEAWNTHGVAAKPSYTVTFRDNGGSGSPGNQTKWYNEDLTLSKTTPTRTGYTFAGWSGSDGKSYSAGSTYSGNAGLTLTAKWNINQYTVTFKDALNSSWSHNVTVNYGSNASPPTPPSHTGYTFSYWDGNYTNVTSHRTVTARYTINKYYIDVNGSLDGVHQSGTSPMGTFDIYVNNSLAMNDATDYWQEHNYQTPYKVQDIKTNTGYNYTGSSGSALSGSVPAGTVSITLNFTTKKYIVSFDANLGEAVSNMPSSFTKTHFVSVKLPSNVPTARRYEFLGWATSSGGEVKYHPGDTYSVEGDATLYAIWKLKASVVKVYQPDGTGKDGICSIYDDAGNHHYAILFCYDENGNRHEVL